MVKLCLKAELILLSMEAEKFSHKAVSINTLPEMTLRQWEVLTNKNKQIMFIYIFTVGEKYADTYTYSCLIDWVMCDFYKLVCL